MAEKDPKQTNPDDKWIKLAEEADLMSTTYMDNNLRKKMEDNIRHFQSKHHAASKYNKSTYKYRSTKFIPKTRSVIRNNEAGASAAFFSNMDMTSIEAQNPDDPVQVASADVNRALIEYRLA